MAHACTFVPHVGPCVDWARVRPIRIGSSPPRRLHSLNDYGWILKKNTCAPSLLSMLLQRIEMLLSFLVLSFLRCLYIPNLFIAFRFEWLLPSVSTETLLFRTWTRHVFLVSVQAEDSTILNSLATCGRPCSLSAGAVAGYRRGILPAAPSPAR
jgi:hypothetical protein